MITKWTKTFLNIFFLTFLMLVNNHELLHAERTKIKVVVFDFGGVIIKTDKQQVINFIAQSLHLSQEEARETLQKMKEQTMSEKEEAKFWTTYAKEKEIPLPAHWLEKIKQIRFETIEEIPGMVNLVKELQKKGYQTALLSNVRESKAVVNRKLGFYNLFYPVIL